MLIDAVPIDQPPGTVAVIEVDMDDVVTAGDAGIDAHTMTPASVLGALAHLGGRVERVLVVGCQPESVDERIGLSEPVAAAVEVAVDEVVKVLDVLTVRRNRWKGAMMRLISGLLFTVLAALVLSAIVRSAPDVNRYLKIRSM